ncbi:TonB-dependent receptor [Parashewanella curva]|uniref:TonB-dependent receptor n=1 Tax=Parashewanella curva TaxID=2338552 RepID=A0A3L8Q2G3_9GAMM|nr:TonB-dependent receptor [Parashewanella curva]RLV61098.1 TonB-dependent receptor [Parashewanella curva]
MNKKFSRSVLSTVISAAIVGSLSISAQAAEDEASKSKKNEDIEKITVSGIRGSVAESLNTKRFDDNFVDAITAEDVGKLPDRNVAEALQRVPGVAIQRDRGEGDFVSIRGLGPDFVRGTVNGRTLVSGTESFDSTLNGGAASTTGRATNFDVLPAEVINKLEVYKTGSASQVEGGIGGVVNIKTARPLQLGTTTAATVRGQYGEFNKKTKPSFSGLHSWVNDDETFGAMAAVSYSDRYIREDIANTFGYLKSPEIDTNSDKKGDLAGAFIPFSANPESFTEERKRTTVNGTLQWLLGEDTQLVADVLVSKRDIDSNQYGAIYSLAPGSQAGVKFCNTEPNEDKSVTCKPELNSGTFTRFPTTANIESFTDIRSGSDESVNFGLNFQHNTENWLFEADYSYADASGELNFGRSVISLVDGLNADGKNIVHTVKGIASTHGDTVSFTPDATDAALLSAANYAIQQTELRKRKNEDSEHAFKFDATYSFDSDIFSELKVGARWRSREKTFDVYFGQNGGRNNPALATAITNSTMRAPSNFLDGSLTGLTPSQLLFPNHQAILNARGKGIDVARQSLESFVAEEETLAGYAQLNVNTYVGDMKLSGNAGVRVVRTNTDVTGQSQKLTLEQQGSINVPVLSGEITDFPFSNSYTNVLPSLNVKLDITEDLVGRFSYSKSLTRPEFEQLAPSLKIINATQRIAGFGNPSLEPYLADNFDLGLEWYFNESSAFTIAGFHKDIDDYIVGSVNKDVTIAGVKFNSVRQPDNQGNAKIKGFEIGYSQAFTFLPEPFDGLGAIVNLTKVSADLKLNNGDKVPFPGVSDTSINTALYYDKDALQARLAYSWRDDFLIDPTDVFGASQLYAEAYGQFDLSVSYEFADGLTGFFEVVNLTDEQEKRYATAIDSPANGTRPLSLGQTGRKINLGVSYKF